MSKHNAGGSTHVCNDLEGWNGGGDGEGGSGGGDLSVCLWLIRVDVWQRPAQYCRASVLR